MPHLLMCSKSTWTPQIRREHALASEAIADGIGVSFFERPADLRDVRTIGMGRWLRRLAIGEVLSHEPTVVARACIVPGHRGQVASRLEQHALQRALRSYSAEGAVVMGMVPWQWPMVPASGVPRRRVFDCADDWGQLIPARADLMRTQYRRIAREADRIVCVSEELVRLFPGADPVIVPNGVGVELLGRPLAPRPRARRLVFVGTLSERVDIRLIEAVLARLPGWSLDIFGPSQYARQGTRAPRALTELVETFAPRVRWHGPIGRDRLAGVIDKADVAIVPFLKRGAVDGSVMKLYDYSARGRAIVATPYSPNLRREAPPGLRVASTATDFADAVLEADGEPGDAAVPRRAWAEERSWQSRWQQWRAAVFGDA